MNNHLPNYEYVSPEMVRKEQTMPERTDCWSVGIIAYEMVFGEHPLDSSKSVIEKNTNNIRKLSKKYSALVEGLLQVNPRDRFTVSKAL